MIYKIRRNLAICVHAPSVKMTDMTSLDGIIILEMFQ